MTEIKLLGVHITPDLKLNKHVDGMVKKANLAIRSLKLLARHGIPAPHLLRIYFSFIRSTLEYCCPVLHIGLTREQSDRVERVQYRALLVISKAPKVLYISLLNQFQLKTLQSRRLKLALSFGNKILSSPIHRNILPPQHQPARVMPLRAVAEPVPKLQPVTVSHNRYEPSFVPSFVKLFNAGSTF